MEPYVEQGTRIGPYVVRGELGRGALGITLLAMDDAGDHFAVKLLLPDAELPKGEVRAQMGLDFATLAALNMPEIPPVARFGRFGDHMMVATQYFPDGSLKSRLEEASITRSGALVMVRHLARSLGAVHDAGVAHGGIKPANIVRRNFGGRVLPVLLDFGASLRAFRWAMFDEDEAAEYFTAPEVLDGEKATPASDVYSMGILLATMLGGRGLSGPLQDVIAMATVDRLDWRYADATQFLHDVERALDDRPTRATAMIVAADKAMAAGREAAEREAAERAEEERLEAERLAKERAAAELLAAEQKRREEKRAAEERAAEDAERAAEVAAMPVPGSRAARRLDREVTRGSHRRRRRMWLILLVCVAAAAIAVTSLLLTKPDLGGKALPNGRGVEPGKRDGSIPGTPGVLVSSAYKGVTFELTRSSGDSTVVQINHDGVWEDVATSVITVPTVVGGQQACAEVRSADKSGSTPTYSKSVKLCGTSNPPALVVTISDAPCIYNGQRQACYGLNVEGFESNSQPTLILTVGGSVRGKFQIVIGSDGRGTLPSGTRFHFAASDAGKTAEVALGGLTSKWTIERP